MIPIHPTSAPPSLDVAQRTLRFLAIFGLIYGAIEFILLLFDLRYWRVWVLNFERILTLNPNSILLGNIQGLFIQYVCSIWLLAACVALLMGKRRAQRALFGWAVFVLGMEMVRMVCSISGPLSLMIANLKWSIDSLSRWMLELGFPAMVAFVAPMCRDNRMLHRGFAVLSDQPVAPISTDLQSSDAEIEPLFLLQCKRQLMQRLAWVGLVFGACALVHCGIALAYGLLTMENRVPPNSPRFPVVQIAIIVQKFSCLMLLAGSLLMLNGKSSGRRLVIVWAMLFLATVATSFCLHDMLFIWWEAHEPRNQVWMQNSAAIPYNALRLSSFAVIALYMLIRLPDARQSTFS